MPSQIDHIVIAVRNLAEASANYEKAGFTVTPGGEHVGGATHNSLVSFADGSYFELIAFTNPDQRPEPPHRWWDQLAAGEGLVDFAVLSADVAAEAAEFSARGLSIVGPFDGGRLRPDGQQVAWRTLRADAGTVPLPFVIEDQTVRELRVPDGAATEHPAGFTGVAGIAIAVSDLEAAKAAYGWLFGTAGEAITPTVPGANTGWVFQLGNHAIELVEPGDESSPLRDHVNARGDGPVEVVLRSATGGGRYLPFDATHGVRIRVID
jgi:catechol 2,3-dioxygenase-like lactoylglutathione lyase family enzyme